MVVYDDDEGMLKDQGLEVVVIPYRQSPPKVSRPPLSPNRNNRRRRRMSSSDNDTTITSSDEDDFQQNNEAPSTPPPPPKQLFTPRSRSLIQEVTGEHIEESIDTQPIIAEKKKESNNNIDNKKGANRVGRSTTRSQSVGRHSKNKTTTSNTKPNPHAKSYPETIAKPKTPPRRSKSTPPQSKTKNKSPLRHPEKLTFVQMAKLGYQELCNAIIRPPRSNYPLSALGPEEFVFCNVNFVRRDFGIVNERGLLLECSIWKKKDEYDGYGEQQQQQQQQQQNSFDKDIKKRNNNRLEHGELILNVDDWDESKEKGQMYLHVPESFEEASATSSFDDNEYNNIGSDNEKDDNTSHEPELLFNISGYEDESPREMPQSSGRRSFGGKRRRDPVVIYLHGNSSGRTEVIPQLGHLLSLGVSVVAFDFAGSGKSEGEFVSLGYYEREDLHTVIKHLRASGDVSTIALWGRSMGAATAIMYGSRDPTISCMILDSSFTDLTQLATEMVERGKEQGVNVPGFVVSVALRMIKNSIKSQAGFSIRHLSPISHVNRCFIPSMFVAGEHDDFIKKRHSEKLHAKYAGDKNIVVVDGDHNSPRPRFLLQSACLFLQSCMQLPPSLELVVPLGTNLMAPPWICPGTFSRLMNKSMQGSSSSKGSDGRNWIPIDGVGQQQKQLQRQRTQPPASMKSSNGYKSPPGMPLEKHSRSMSDAASPTTEDYCGASELPDMSERQKEIQSSLFKMLGQHE